MLKLPKGLKKKKGKKSKRKGEAELFTQEELEKYRKEHQHQTSEGSESQQKENEEWSKFKDLTTGIDSVLKKTQGDLDRIKSTSFFQRIPAGSKETENTVQEIQQKSTVEFKKPEVSDFVSVEVKEGNDEADKSDYGATDTESEEEEQDDIFDTSYVEAVERGEVKLAYVPDSPEEFQDDGLFDTSHVEAVIKGQETKTSKGKKALDIGVAVEVLTGRIDNVTITTKKSKRVIPDLDADLPVTTPIDLSVSLHTSFIQQQKQSEETVNFLDEKVLNTDVIRQDSEDDEFTLLAAESIESSGAATKIENEIKIEPVLEESWSAFEAITNESVFAESIIIDQIDVDPFIIDESDPFDTSFAESVVPSLESREVKKEAVILEDDDDFDPRAEEVKVILNNRRKSSVKIHLTDPFGIRESITSDDTNEKEDNSISRDLLGGSSTTDLNQLGDSPLNPVDVNSDLADPFDTTSVDKIVAPGKVELKLLEQELIGVNPIYRVLSDPDFDPRADENIKETERRASRPENLLVGSKSVVFKVEDDTNVDLDLKIKPIKPVTPYYNRELSITEVINEDSEANDYVSETLSRTRSDEDLAPKLNYQAKRRHSEYPQSTHKVPNFKIADIFDSSHSEIKPKVLTPSAPNQACTEIVADPFDTSFATDIVPSRTELKLLAKEFSCEDTTNNTKFGQQDLLDPSDDIFQAKALTPEPTNGISFSETASDPFDTSFASDLKPGKTEIKLLESEFLN
ncbi:Protein stoned-A [Eumeta japonica]|uniref:Protein stoned-A n=1 Tax=Eumeta variegata TaxID=151549 RepID=A0A4C1U887_EUMVA|nr:Protein stoned-A [Eumeta japonica]